MQCSNVSLKRSACTERDNRHTVRRTELNDLANLFGGTREDNGVWRAAFMIGLILAMLFANGQRRAQALVDGATECI